jgi:small subunit ribosomal protein S1
MGTFEMESIVVRLSQKIKLYYKEKSKNKEKENKKVMSTLTIQTEQTNYMKGGADFTPGITVKLEDISGDKEYSEEEYERLKQLYEHKLSKFSEGEIVTGRILAINEKEISIDIGFKSEGTIPVSEFDSTENLKVGDSIEVFLESVENQDGQLVLSKRKADFMRIWEKVVRAQETNETITGKCVRRIKGGIVVDLMGVDAFLPGSQIDTKPIRDFDIYLGKTLPFKVVKINHLRKNIVVSHRVIVEEKLKEQRGKILTEMEKGQTREGVVKNITDFGVFIDLGGVDGLIHITDLSWGRINHPSEVVQMDQKIMVKILDFDDNKERIALGLKQLQPNPWENIDAKYSVGVKVKGKVVNLTDYGAFIEIEKGIEGLVHVSEMAWGQAVKNPSEKFKLGDEVEAVILTIEKNEKKISLGIKQLTPDPWGSIESMFPVGSRHKGIIKNITQFGAFVELKEGIDGLVHISDLSWTKKLRHPSDMVKKGDEIEVIVLGINREERRIALGHKQIEEDPWGGFEEIYKVGTEAKGKITRFMEKGAIVELLHGVEGFVSFNHFAYPDFKKVSEAFKVDDELPLKVTEFDKDSKKIVLSVDEYFKGRDKTEYEAYLMQHQYMPKELSNSDRK